MSLGVVLLVSGQVPSTTFGYVSKLGKTENANTSTLSNWSIFILTTISEFSDISIFGHPRPKPISWLKSSMKLTSQSHPSMVYNIVHASLRSRQITRKSRTKNVGRWSHMQSLMLKNLEPQNSWCPMFGCINNFFSSFPGFFQNLVAKPELSEKRRKLRWDSEGPQHSAQSLVHNQCRCLGPVTSPNSAFCANKKSEIHTERIQGQNGTRIDCQGDPACPRSVIEHTMVGCSVTHARCSKKVVFLNPFTPKFGHFPSTWPK